jgi:predicted nucleotidyltransferase
MDFIHPVEAVIPGAVGRLLAALARVDAELPVSRLATVAGVGRTRASGLLGDLAEMGIVSRRQVGATTLVRLERRNIAGDLVAQLGNIHQTVIERLRDLARRLDPQPVTLLAYGSFARGAAGPASDIDILAIRSTDVDPDQWSDCLTQFSVRAQLLTGNSVHVLDYAAEDFQRRYATRAGDAGAEFWGSVTRDAVMLTGVDLEELMRVGHDTREQSSPGEQGGRRRLPDQGAELAERS